MFQWFSREAGRVGDQGDGHWATFNWESQKDSNLGGDTEKYHGVQAKYLFRVSGDLWGSWKSYPELQKSD